MLDIGAWPLLTHAVRKYLFTHVLCLTIHRSKPQWPLLLLVPWLHYLLFALFVICHLLLLFTYIYFVNIVFFLYARANFSCMDLQDSIPYNCLYFVDCILSLHKEVVNSNIFITLGKKEADRCQQINTHPLLSCTCQLSDSEGSVYSRKVVDFRFLLPLSFRSSFCLPLSPFISTRHPLFNDSYYVINSHLGYCFLYWFFVIFCFSIKKFILLHFYI